jgi:ribosomal-protein-alanine N-acetyltransferase
MFEVDAMVKNWTEVLYDNETLETERLTLRRFRKNDAEDVHAYASDMETLKYIIWPGVKSVEEAGASIVEYYWSRPGIYCIALRETDQCIGCIDLRVEPEHEKASFGYMLNRGHWGRGYMTEALTALLSLSFDRLDLNRVEATHFTVNGASGRVMEKSGMAFEGVSPQELKVKGVFRDVVHYGITKTLWQEQHAK